MSTLTRHCLFVQICSEFHRITNVNLKNRFYAQLDQHGRRLQSLFRKKAARTGKVAEALEQLFSAYDRLVSEIHFLVLDWNNTVDYVCVNSSLHSLIIECIEDYLFN